MVSSRAVTALVGLAASLLVSVLAWIYFGTPVLFLFVPFIPFLFWREDREEAEPPERECPVCGFRTRDPSYAYCPRDGEPLE